MSRPIDYTSKDYESFRHDMLALRHIKTPEWTSQSESDPGIAIIELLAHGLDILSYYQDRNANEAYLPTARLRRSVIDLTSLIGYELGNSVPSRAKVQVTFSSPLTQDRVFPKGFKVGTRRTPTEESIVFEVSETTVIPAGTLQTDGVTVPHLDVVQGFTVNNEILGSGDGSADQKFTFSRSPVIIDDSLIVWVREGNVWNAWTRVEDFIYSSPSDRHYTLFTDENGRVEITFGNGIHGARVPVGNNNVRADYRVGGGTVGNVGANTIVRVISSGIPGIASITNPEEPYLKGIDRESIENAKRVAPRLFRSRDTLVTLLDHEDAAENFEGVERAQAVLDQNRNVIIYIMPNNRGLPTQDLKDRLKAELDTKRILTVDITIEDPDYVEVDLTAHVTAMHNHRNSVVQSSVESEIQSFFQSLGFNQDVLLGSLFRAVMSVEGVANVSLYHGNGSLFSDVEIGEGQVAILGSLDVVVTGGA